MIVYKHSKAFGPVGSYAGNILFFSGIVLLLFSFTGLILIILGAFFGFSDTSTLVETEHKRIRFSNNFFGIIKTGKWIAVEPNMKIGIRKSNKVWRTYSLGNRTNSIEEKKYVIMLYDSKSRYIMPIKKVDVLEEAKSETEVLAKQLGLEII